MLMKAKGDAGGIGGETEDHSVQRPFLLLLMVSLFWQKITHATYTTNFEGLSRCKLPRVL